MAKNGKTKQSGPNQARSLGNNMNQGKTGSPGSGASQTGDLASIMGQGKSKTADAPVGKLGSIMRQ